MKNTVVNYADMKPEIPASILETLKLTGHDIKIIHYALAHFVTWTRGSRSPAEPMDALEQKVRNLLERVVNLDNFLHG